MTGSQRRVAKSRPAKSGATSRQANAGGASETAAVGQYVRQERQRMGLSMRELARRLGVSASFLSQFELGQSQAAVSTLFAIATELNLSLDELVASSTTSNGSTHANNGPRSGRGKPVHYLSFQTGVRWRRLAELGHDRVDFLLTEYEPGADSAPADAPQRHKGNDYGYVLEGTLTVIVNGRRRRVTAGNAIAMRGDVPHRLLNDTDELVRAIWFVTD